MKLPANRNSSSHGTGILYCGDNLEVMRRYLADDSVDLVYLDPPFCTNRNYAVTQKAAFSDTWRWDEPAWRQVSAAVPALAGLLAAVRTINPAAGAYLVMMAPRLAEIKRVLSNTGSVYLHCDPAAAHYLKLVMDGLFGPENFRNEIIWAYKGGGRSTRQFARKHDTILFYSRGDAWTFNYREIMVDRTNRTWFTDEDGRRYWLKYGKRYYLRHDGKVPEDWWTDIDPLHGPYKERLGYPTQKPLSLLERIVLAGSNAGETILDPFCGSGTTLAVAETNGRRWIGIDSNPEAVRLAAGRIDQSFPGASFDIVRLSA